MKRLKPWANSLMVLQEQGKSLRVLLHRIIASRDWVWAHANFLNLYNEDPNDRGIAGVDNFRFDSDGKIVEHWDVLQEVP